ncbi:hypothetical protein [Virgibacillus pantothenticus]|uniref:hypothetical protein n=1 Tax=Virgibacillus pantothenticus TaxID=1473 RepID=UPI000986535A|nr:hypothetical protein [Virgibacillus pantothenticus]
MNILKGLLLTVGCVIAVFAGIIFGIYFAVAFGYFIGILIVSLPFLSGWLTDSIGISPEQIPNITAWMVVLRLLITAGNSFRNLKEGEG